MGGEGPAQDDCLKAVTQCVAVVGKLSGCELLVLGYLYFTAFYSPTRPNVICVIKLITYIITISGSQDACEQTSYLFLRKELLVRLANIMKEINLLPDQLLSMPSVQLVESW